MDKLTIAALFAAGIIVRTVLKVRDRSPPPFGMKDSNERTALPRPYKRTTPHTLPSPHPQDLIGDITSPLLLLGFGIFVWYKRREDKRRRNVVARVRLRHIIQCNRVAVGRDCFPSTPLTVYPL